MSTPSTPPTARHLPVPATPAKRRPALTPDEVVRRRQEAALIAIAEFQATREWARRGELAAQILATTGGRPASECWAPIKPAAFAKRQRLATTGGRPASECWAPCKVRRMSGSDSDSE